MVKFRCTYIHPNSKDTAYMVEAKTLRRALFILKKKLGVWRVRKLDKPDWWITYNDDDSRGYLIVYELADVKQHKTNGEATCL